MRNDTIIWLIVIVAVGLGVWLALKDNNKKRVRIYKMSLKSELKNGAVVECRNGCRFIKIDNTFLTRNADYMEIDDYEENLSCPKDKGYDVIKINNNVANNDGYLNGALFDVLYNEHWTCERPPEILDESEKKYLSAVIKPFRDKVDGIVKGKCCDGYCIVICLNKSSVTLPPFKRNKKMYEGMEANISYTLEELGLRKDRI